MKNSGWILLTISISLIALSFVMYARVSDPKVIEQSKTIFPYNKQLYLGVTFKLTGLSTKTSLDHVNITNIDRYSHYVLPYELLDYTIIPFSDGRQTPLKLDKDKTYTIIIGPIKEEEFNEHTEIGLLFNDYYYSFD